MFISEMINYFIRIQDNNSYIYFYKLLDKSWFIDHTLHYSLNINIIKMDLVPTHMNAIVLEKAGAPAALTKIPVPTPLPG